jgi:hypothetical protein
MLQDLHNMMIDEGGIEERTTVISKINATASVIS